MKSKRHYLKNKASWLVKFNIAVSLIGLGILVIITFK